MVILLGIIVFQWLVIARSKISLKEGTPYFSIFIISLLLVAFFIYMMFTLESSQS